MHRQSVRIINYITNQKDTPLSDDMLWVHSLVGDLYIGQTILSMEIQILILASDAQRIDFSLVHPIVGKLRVLNTLSKLS